MKNMKKFAALLLTAAMTVAMVGCGSSVAANTVNSKDDLPGKKIGVSAWNNRRCRCNSI